MSELCDFVRIPSVSADPARASQVAACAAWLGRHLEELGPDRVEVLDTAGHPLVRASWMRAPGKPTLLIYGHYDVQPAEPLDAWNHPPFQPVIRGNDLHGRGASDDKGQVFVHLKALESLLKTEGTLPINVQVLIEGEEEIGSPGLSTYLRARPRAMSPDAVLISDTRMTGPGQPVLTYGLRGALGLELTVAQAKEVHSGAFGGAVGNPIHVVCGMIAAMQGPRGRIGIPGLYDSVRPASSSERARLARAARTDRQILNDAGACPGWGETGFSVYERTTIRPAVSVTGMRGGYTGTGHKSSIPATASARFNFRLVPDQDPDAVEGRFRRFVAAHLPCGFRATVTRSLAARPVLMNRDSPPLRAAARAAAAAFGRPPSLLRSGGTIPVAGLFHEMLHVPVVLLGFALPDDGMHAPNEKFHLPNFFLGISAGIRLMCLLADDRSWRQGSGRGSRSRKVPLP